MGTRVNIFQSWKKLCKHRYNFIISFIWPVLSSVWYELDQNLFRHSVLQKRISFEWIFTTIAQTIRCKNARYKVIVQLSLELLVGSFLNSPPFLNASVPCPHFSYANEEVFQAVDAFELGSQAMVEIETQTGGIECIVWFWADWMFWRFLLNLKGQCTKHREFPPP